MSPAMEFVVGIGLAFAIMYFVRKTKIYWTIIDGVARWIAQRL